MYKYTLLKNFDPSLSSIGLDFLYNSSEEIYTLGDHTTYLLSNSIEQQYYPEHLSPEPFSANDIKNISPVKMCGFLSDAEIKSMAMKNLSLFYTELISYLEIDIYYAINFTCKFHEYTKPTNAHIDNFISKLGLAGYHRPAYVYMMENLSLENYDLPEDPDNLLFDSYFRLHQSITLPFSNPLVLDKGKTNQYNSLKMYSLCPRLALYIYQNLYKVPWYDIDEKDKKNSRPNYNNYSLYNLLEVESFGFKPWEFYIFEQETNVNSVIVMAEFLNNALTKKEAKSLIDGTLNTMFKQELDALIKVLALSPLSYSKSIILKILFDKACKIFDNQRDLNYIIRYVKEQFCKINSLFTTQNKYIVVSQERLSEYFNEAKRAGITELDEIFAKIDELNEERFNKNILSNFKFFRKDNLIKTFNPSPILVTKEKVNNKPQYLNVYIQKLVINYKKISKKNRHLSKKRIHKHQIILKKD